MLEELSGVQVVGYATNGEEGIRRVIDLKPDLVTLDLEMPRMDGFTMLRILMASTPVPVIVISADATPNVARRLLDAGAAEYLTKPLDVRRLLDVINSLLSEHGAAGVGRGGFREARAAPLTGGSPRRG